MVDHSQRSQRLDQRELALIEIAELAVALQHRGHLAAHRIRAARQQHPQVLDRRAHHRVVEVNDVRPLAIVAPQDVAGVAIAVQPQHPGRHRRHGLVDRGQCLFAALAPRAELGHRNLVQVQQPGQRRVAKGRGVQRSALLEHPLFADRVQPGDESAQPAQRLWLVQLWAMAGPARVSRQPESLAFDQRMGQGLA